MLAIEAKVVCTPGSLADYLRDVNDKFISGVAAPLVGEGAMIAYTLTTEGIPSSRTSPNASS